MNTNLNQMTKQNLIKMYPEQKSYILEQYDYYQGLDEFGKKVWQQEFDIPMTKENLFNAVLMDVENVISLSPAKESFIYSEIAGENISIKDHLLYLSLSNQPSGIYGA